MKFILLVSIFFICLSCTKKTTTKTSNIPFVPNDVSLIIKCNNLKQLQHHLNNNSLIQKNQNNPLVDYFKNIGPLTLLTAKDIELYLCYSPIGKTDFGYTLITPLKNSLLSAEKIKENTYKTFTYNTYKYHQIKYKKAKFYTVSLDSTWIASDNKLLIENSIREFKNTLGTKESNYKNAFKILEENNSFSIIINNNKSIDAIQRLLPNYNTKNLEPKNWSGWTAGDFNVSNNAIVFDGIYKPKDSIYDYLNLFKNTQAQTNQLAKITPSGFKNFTSYTYSNYSQLSKNIALYNYKDIDLKKDAIDNFMSKTNEFGLINLNDEEILAFSLINSSIEITNYLNTNSKNENFRDFTLSQLENPIDFNQKLKPLFLNSKKVNYYLQINNFVLFANEKKALKEIISAIKNEDILNSKNWYTSFSENIATQSNILYLQNTSSLVSNIKKNTPKPYQKAWGKSDFKDYKLMATQCISENNFIHIHQIISKSKSKKSDFIKVRQTSSIVLEDELINRPQFVKNHVTKGMDATVQDKNNTLYLINNFGKILWKKEIESKILGQIKQMDMYRNGRLQLVFTTANKLYVLDRNGNNVAPFPLNFNKQITQPVAVFDYDNRRKYRIAIAQNDKLSLFDNKGKEVKGFLFKNESNGTITHLPKHIKVGTKDYIVVNESNTGVHFLKRTGEERIKVKSKLPKTTNEWYWYKNRFSTLSEENSITQISTEGVLTAIKPPFNTENAFIDVTPETWVTFSENTLSIENKKVDLEFGIYSNPKIFYINKKIYISITDKQASKIYLFDSNAKPINGFPIYGNSLIDLNNIDKDNSLEIITQGEKNSLLFYEMN